jgi:hypothetical protein
VTVADLACDKPSPNIKKKLRAVAEIWPEYAGQSL